MNIRLSKEMYETPESAVEELIQNSIDADATEIKIEINDNSIIFEDNGTGFDKERMYAFCEQATDYKQIHKITIKGRKMKGSKGIGRYAIFKLAGLYEVRTRTKKHPVNIGTFWRVDLTKYVVGDKLEIEPTVWSKDKINGTEFILTNLTVDGKLLKKRIEKLIERIAMNWDLEECSIYINGEKLQPEDIKYESGSFREYDRTIIGNIYVKGKIGLMTKGANINGITIKVKKRGVGSPSFFGIEKSPLYLPFLSRIRGVLFIDTLDNIINASRSGFIKTEKKYQIVSNFIKKEIEIILEKKLRQREKIEKTKIDKILKEYFKSINNILKELFKTYKGAFKDLSKGKISEGEEEVSKLVEGEERARKHEKGRRLIKKSLKIDGITKIDENKIGKLKIGRYSWLPERRSLGSGEKLIVVDYDKLKVILNEDHPAFKKYTTPKNLGFLTTEIIYAISLTTKEFSDEELRNIVDEFMRKRNETP